MKVTRRQFLKVTGATAASFALVDLGFNLQATASAVKELRIKNVTPVPTVCPYCASGCGLSNRNPAIQSLSRVQCSQ
jgi:formate dehydrogenase major subunit